MPFTTSPHFARAWSARLLRGGVVVLLACSTGLPLSADQRACDAIKSSSFDHTTIVSASMTPADAASGAPAYCEVSATIAPVPGSSIGVVYRLPEGWNGKMVGLGGGGWAGNIQLATAMPGLKTGYATAQTDGGHPIPVDRPDIWRPDKWGTPETFADFQYRAIHLMTTVGKAVVSTYYGKPQDKAYFQGCSTGGRQGLVEVQRYPEDYDAVISMAPVYSLSVQTSAAVRANELGKPGGALSPEILSRVNTAVLAACDGRDGLADGLLSDPRQCRWDPSELLCKAGQPGAECLTSAQVESLKTLYDGVRTRDGRFVAWPLGRGGEAGWRAFIGLTGPSSDATNAGGLGALTGPVFGNPSFNLASFDPQKDYDTASKSDFAKNYEAANPDIAAFTNRGGKLLLWHGWNDPGPSPWLTLDYYERVSKSVPAAASNVRLFMSPGVGHCSGGPGLDQIDMLAALDAWVQSGKAPDTLLARKAKPVMSRPVCAYPKVATYKGSGDATEAASFECR